MTRNQIDAVRDDIAYMRAMAEEGRKAPLLGGAILIAAGLTFGSASLLQWAAAAGVAGVTFELANWGWLAAMVAFIAALSWLSHRLKGRPGACSPVNKAAGTAWMGVGMAIFFMAVSMALIAWRLNAPEVMLLFPSLIFALYGAGWAVSAAMSDKKWLWWVAIGAWVGAPLIALLTGDPAQYLAYAVGLLLLTVAPGLALIRQEPAEVI